MSFGVVASVGGSLISGAMSSKASKSAAKSQEAAARESNALNREIFEKQTALQEPFRTAGIGARNSLLHRLGLENHSQQTRPRVAAAPRLSADQIRQNLLPQFTTGQGDYHRSATDGETKYEEAVKGNSVVDEAGLQAAIAAQLAQQGNNPEGAQDTDSDFGSLNREFGQAQFNADGAPKIGDFNEQAPEYQDFDRTAPEYQAYGRQAPEYQPLDRQAPEYQDFARKLPEYRDFTRADFDNDPGLQFRLEQGQKQLENSAAGRGGLFSGQTGMALTKYAQGVASDEYGRAFDRYQTQYGQKLGNYNTDLARHQGEFGIKAGDYQNAFNRNLTEFNTKADDYQRGFGRYQSEYANRLNDFTGAFGRYQTEYGNRNADFKDKFARHQVNRTNRMSDYLGAYDRFQTQRTNTINPLLSLMGSGQTAANATSNAAQNYGALASSAIQGAGNARASGQIGSANAWNSAIGQGINAWQNKNMMDMYAKRPAPITPSMWGNQSNSQLDRGINFGEW